MNVKVLALKPTSSIENKYQVTHELLASCGAKYSRSNKGIDTILDTIDWNNPDASVDKIFKFVDYGHASIAGLTGGIPIVIDGCSMFLAYKIFDIAQLCDGQESSTRYIKMSSDSLPNPDEIGIPKELQDDWFKVMSESYAIYNKEYERLDSLINSNPELLKVPKNYDDKVFNRLRRNYALDRCRYFIPFVTKTNAVFVMTARVWAETLKELESIPSLECQNVAKLIRSELLKVVPRLLRHCYSDEASIYHQTRYYDVMNTYLKYYGIGTTCIPDKFWVDVNESKNIANSEIFDYSFNYKENRYSSVSSDIKRNFVRFGFNNISIAEYRDLNRHRSGNRFSPLIPKGFYLPPEIKYENYLEFFQSYSNLIKNFTNYNVTSNLQASTVYSYLLGTQVEFEHVTSLDKFIYEIELRTGMGAHFRYSEHCNNLLNEFLKCHPEYEPYIIRGTAEPE